MGYCGAEVFLQNNGTVYIGFLGDGKEEKGQTQEYRQCGGSRKADALHPVFTADSVCQKQQDQTCQEKKQVPFSGNGIGNHTAAGKGHQCSQYRQPDPFLQT